MYLLSSLKCIYGLKYGLFNLKKLIQQHYALALRPQDDNNIHTD